MAEELEMVEEEAPVPVGPALELELQAGEVALTIRVNDRTLAACTLGAAGLVGLALFFRRNPLQVANAITRGLEALGRALNFRGGSVVFELICDAKLFSGFSLELFSIEIKQRVEKAFEAIGFFEELEVTITDTAEPDYEVNQLREEKDEGEYEDLGESFHECAEQFEIFPSAGSMEGGRPFVLECLSDIPKNVTSALAIFDHCGTVQVDRMGNTFVGIHPAAKEPGIVDVVVMTQSGQALGTARFTYVDDKLREIMEELVSDRSLQALFVQCMLMK